MFWYLDSVTVFSVQGVLSIFFYIDNFFPFAKWSRNPIFVVVKNMVYISVK